MLWSRRMRIGAVVIGRNEGARLRRCLDSLVASRASFAEIVYVDSNSDDGSVTLARSLCVEVVALDVTTPFTAARARNAGFKRLVERAPDVEVVQFIDGDCELLPAFVGAAIDALADESVAAVAGRLRERDVQASIYNRLCDVEWDGPVGDVDFVGGIAAYRASAFRGVDGFDPRLIAGEEPELCLRLRRRGHRIVRISDDMALHDAAMVRFSQCDIGSARHDEASSGAWRFRPPRLGSCRSRSGRASHSSGSIRCLRSVRIARCGRAGTSVTRLRSRRSRPLANSPNRSGY